MTRLCPPEAKTLSDGLPIVLGFTESREGVPEVTEDKTAETPEQAHRRSVGKQVHR